jgi:16S rRNA C967 or C1407 C5-methylase (RsmB/RsmF family)
LVYGACTFRKEETSEQAAGFSAQHSDFEPIAGGFYGPFDDADGFYMHAWRKKP